MPVYINIAQWHTFLSLLTLPMLYLLPIPFSHFYFVVLGGALPAAFAFFWCLCCCCWVPSHMYLNRACLPTRLFLPILPIFPRPTLFCLFPYPKGPLPPTSLFVLATSHSFPTYCSLLPQERPFPPWSLPHTLLPLQTSFPQLLIFVALRLVACCSLLLQAGTFCACFSVLTCERFGYARG